MKAEENQRTRLTRRLLQESLLALLGEKSIEKITVKELCERAQLNRTTFYLHYGSPEDVLEEIENGLIAKTQETLAQIGAHDAALRLESMLVSIQKNERVFRLLLCENGHDSFRMRFFASVFPHGIADETFSRTNGAVRPYVDGYLVGGAFAAVYTWIAGGFALPVRDLARLLSGLSVSAAAYCEENARAAGE